MYKIYAALITGKDRCVYDYKYGVTTTNRLKTIMIILIIMIIIICHIPWKVFYLVARVMT